MNQAMNQAMNLHLEDWFLRHRCDNPDNLSHSKTFRIMKQYLKQMEYWRNLPRGNPQAGHKAQQTSSGESFK